MTTTNTIKPLTPVEISRVDFSKLKDGEPFLFIEFDKKKLGYWSKERNRIESNHAYHEPTHIYLEVSEEENKWIDANKENPKDYQDVLVLLENGEVFKATYCDDVEPLGGYTSEYFKFNKGVKITHWQPLPQSHLTK